MSGARVTTTKRAARAERKLRFATGEEILCAELSEGMARLMRLVERHRRGEPQNAEDEAALYLALENILDGENPAKALRIDGTQSQGRGKRNAGEVEKIEIMPVLLVERLRRESTLRGEHPALSVDRAIEQVVAALAPDGPKFQTIRAYRRKHGESARACLDFIEENERFVDEWRRRTAMLPKDVVKFLGTKSAQAALGLLRRHQIDGRAPREFVLTIRKLMKKGGGKTN